MKNEFNKKLIDINFSGFFLYAVKVIFLNCNREHENKQVTPVSNCINTPLLPSRLDKCVRFNWIMQNCPI